MSDEPVVVKKLDPGDIRMIAVNIQQATDATNHLAQYLIAASPRPEMLGTVAIMFENVAARLLGQDMTQYIPHQLLTKECAKQTKEIKAQADALAAKDKFITAQNEEIERLQTTVRDLSTRPTTMLKE